MKQVDGPFELSFFQFLWLLMSGNLCRHRYWFSGGYGAYCARCLERVEVQ